MGFQKIIPYKNPRHGAPGSIGSSTSTPPKSAVFSSLPCLLCLYTHWSSRNNWPVSEGKILKFWVEVKEELYLPSSENRCADQLCSYCTADLRLCFRIGKNPVFSFMTRLIYLEKDRLERNYLYNVSCIS